MKTHDEQPENVIEHDGTIEVETKAKKGKGKKKEVDDLDILEVRRGTINVAVLGTTPLICNRLSEKAKQELLMPKGRKNAVERATMLKHDPYAEFRNSPYRLTHGDTLIGLLASSYKRSMMTAALDLPGTKKAQIGRLTWVEGQYSSIYGLPELFMATVRSADMNRTPDIRTRAILPRWACRLQVTFIEPLIKAQAVVRLLAAAGMFIGVGDWRNEKGSGTFGSFQLVDEHDAEFQDIVKTGGREAQEKALENPVAHDAETADLLAWFDAEKNRRQMKGVS